MKLLSNINKDIDKTVEHNIKRSKGLRMIRVCVIVEVQCHILELKCKTRVS